LRIAPSARGDTSTDNWTIFCKGIMHSPASPQPLAIPPFAPRTFRVPRTNEKDLQFDGYLIGQAHREVEFPDRSVTVSLYTTVGGKYITQIERGELKDSSGPRAGVAMPAQSKAAVHESGDAAYEWLLADGKGKLGAVSKAAWEEACRIWPMLHGQDIEIVE
jgi:hypothetical protein